MIRATLALVALVCTTAVFAADNLAAAYGEDWKSLPDWRGVWYLEQPLLFTGPENAVIGKTGDGKSTFEYGITPGSHFKGAPYKPEYQKRYDERIARARAGTVEDPIETCFTPHGMPRVMGAVPGAAEFHVTPKQTWIIFDYMNQTRRIRTDGRTHPGPDMEWPRVMGHSVGKWEGQTLVVDTVWTKEGVYDRSGAPHSDKLHIVERITKTDPETLTVEMTIEDPVMFTAPWQVTRRFKKSPKKWESVPGYYCEYEGAQFARPAE
jgi:hypothetical protein